MTGFLRLTPSLRVRDLRRSVAFYTGSLGFTVDTLWPGEEPTLAILDQGNVSVMLHTGGCDDDGPPSFTGDLRFDVSDLGRLARSLQGRVSFEWGPEVYHYGRREFAVRDPDGYLLVFSERASDPGPDDEPDP